MNVTILLLYNSISIRHMMVLNKIFKLRKFLLTEMKKKKMEKSCKINMSSYIIITRSHLHYQL